MLDLIKKFFRLFSHAPVRQETPSAPNAQAERKILTIQYQKWRDEEQALSIVYSIVSASEQPWAKIMAAHLQESEGVQRVPVQDVKAEQAQGAAGKFEGATWRVGTRAYIEAGGSIPEHIFLEVEHAHPNQQAYYVTRQQTPVAYFLMQNV